MTTQVEYCQEGAVQELVESARERLGSRFEVVGSLADYDNVRQGDLYIVKIPKLPQGKPLNLAKLVPGDTQGSQHVLDGPFTAVEVDDKQGLSKAIAKAIPGCDVPVGLIGPAFHCDDAVTLTHPEHGHKQLPAGSTWVTVYQRSYAEEVRRVMD